MNLRQKLLLALLPMVATLVAIGTISVHTARLLGRSSQSILEDNYRSVLAAERMQAALDGMEDAAVFLALGERERGLRRARESRPRFEAELDAQQHNITEVGEAEATRELADGWRQYLELFNRLLGTADLADVRRSYLGTLEPEAETVRAAAAQVLAINEDAMVRKSEAAHREMQRADELLLFATALALLLGVVASGAFTARLLRPLSVLTQAVRRLGDGDLQARAVVRGNDEVAQLARDFNVMADRLRQYRESSLGELLLAQGASQAAIDSLADAVVIFDTEGGVLSTNEAAARLLRIELRGDLQPLAQADPVIREVLDRLRTHVLTGKGAYQPKGLEEAIRLDTPEGLRYLLPRATPVHAEGQLHGAAVVLQDVTRLQRFDELTNNLVATVAHELRTPLTSLRMAIHLCLELAAGPLTEKQQDLLFAAREDCERLQGMVDDLLDLSRLQAGREALSFEAVSARTLVEEARDRYQGLAAEGELALVAEDLTGDRAVQVDPERIKLVFANLVANAIRHSPRGGTATVRARPLDQAVRFEVSDQGLGVPAEYQQRVFEKFFRAPGATGPGAGLGLYIAREIVLAHGGEIGVTSEAGKGSTFWFTLAAA
ncbi:MAG: HAMP domain-containing sensor histidine kinase [Myxococcales bacterium]